MKLFKLTLALAAAAGGILYANRRNRPGASGATRARFETDPHLPPAAGDTVDQTIWTPAEPTGSDAYPRPAPPAARDA